MTAQPRVGDAVRIVAPWPADARGTDVGLVGTVLRQPLGGPFDAWIVRLPDGGLSFASTVEDMRA